MYTHVTVGHTHAGGPGCFFPVGQDGCGAGIFPCIPCQLTACGCDVESGLSLSSWDVLGRPPVELLNCLRAADGLTAPAVFILLKTVSAVPLRVCVWGASTHTLDLMMLHPPSQRLLF